MMLIRKRNVSIKKIFLLLIFVVSIILIVIIFNIRYTVTQTIIQTSLNLIKQKSEKMEVVHEGDEMIAKEMFVKDISSKQQQKQQPQQHTHETTTIRHIVNSLNEYENRPWFLKNGQQFPKQSIKSHIKLFPEDVKNNDRIVNQLMYIPTNYSKNGQNYKLIYLSNGANSWFPYIFETENGNSNMFKIFHGCPVNRCTVATNNRWLKRKADAILFKDGNVPKRMYTSPKQVWIMYLLECPYHTGDMPRFGQINWTATYRTDSDIVTPYERWVPYYNIYKNISDYHINLNKNNDINYAKNKTKQVAWFVSNCHAKNKRLQYGNELQKYINVDIYGSCGSLYCPRGKKSNECFDTLNRDYKFYLAFENSNCKDYITEKFFFNGLQYNVIPIVMGGTSIEEYSKVAPPNSFIHVDEFTSPEELSEYLKTLDKHDHLYNKYFKWKNTGEFINTYFWCRLCAMLHSLDSDYSDFSKNYDDLNVWWRSLNTCKP